MSMDNGGGKSKKEFGKNLDYIWEYILILMMWFNI
jgi:hypothetical protein